MEGCVGRRLPNHAIVLGLRQRRSVRGGIGRGQTEAVSFFRRRIPILSWRWSGKNWGSSGRASDDPAVCIFCLARDSDRWARADPFGRYLGMGITLLIGGAGAGECAVVTGLLPTKGLTLPFVSYGGSSLVVSLFGVGILLSISRRPAMPAGLEVDVVGRITDDDRHCSRWNRWPSLSRLLRWPESFSGATLRPSALRGHGAWHRIEACSPTRDSTWF